MACQYRRREAEPANRNATEVNDSRKIPLPLYILFRRRSDRTRRGAAYQSRRAIRSAKSRTRPFDAQWRKFIRKNRSTSGYSLQICTNIGNKVAGYGKLVSCCRFSLVRAISSTGYIACDALTTFLTYGRPYGGSYPRCRTFCRLWLRCTVVRATVHMPKNISIIATF